jgi:hypothetical protein
VILFHVGSGTFDKAKEATKKNAISKLRVLEEYLVRDKMNQVNTSVGCFLAQTQRSYLDLWCTDTVVMFFYW